MFGFNIRTRQTAASAGAAGSPKINTDSPSTTSPKMEVGEIDTRAPFQSVKAAVGLFGERASPKNKPLYKKALTADERVLEKETQLHLALKELDKFKEQLKAAEATKAQAQRELERANRTLEELTSKLETASEFKQAAIAATEAAKDRAKELEKLKSNKDQLDDGSWKQDVNKEREQYKASAAELNAAKQELNKIRRDFDAALETKLVAFQEAADAEHTTKVNKERLNELSRELESMREMLVQVKLATFQAQEEQTKTMAEKEARLQSHGTAKEEIVKKIQLLKREEEELNLLGNLEEKLEETYEATAVLQEQLENVRDSDMRSLKGIIEELEDAKRAMQDVSQEESSLRSLVDSLKLELDTVKRELSEMEQKEAESKLAAENLQGELERNKVALEAALAGESKQGNDSNDINSSIQQLKTETEIARCKAEEMRRSTQELKQEAETTRNLAKEIENKLEVVVKEAEDAKAAAKLATEQMYRSSSSSSADATDQSIKSEFKDKIKLSIENYESLNRKVEEFQILAQTKMAAAIAEVEACNAREREARKKLEESLKEMEDMKAATDDALKQAEMAEAAKHAVEGELQKWRQKEESG
ncbi:hypothetical protein NMG60_11010007 [Bertholletia excelsa]